MVTKAYKDKTLEEFEKKDLGSDMKKAGGGTLITPVKQKPTSILLGEDLINKLKRKAKKRNLPYQTFLIFFFFFIF